MAASPVWTHPYATGTNVNAFRDYVNRTHSLNLRDYKELHAWSVADIDVFAWAIWAFCGIKYSTPPTAAALGLENMYPRPEWFPRARMNYSENMLALGLSSRPDSIAVTVCQEGGLQIEEYTFKQLETEVARWTNALRSMGIGVGDRITTVLPNTVDCLVLLLAAGAVGAIFSSTSPDMGTESIVERYSQLKPKILICYSEVSYGGKKIDLRPKLAKANRQLEGLVPELEYTLVIKGRLFEGHNVKSGRAVLRGMSTDLFYEQLPFDHPIYILYSSGTTGPPKCICHSAGGALLQNKKELILSYDLGINSVFYQYTTTGRMMWNLMVAALSCGSRIVLFDGSPLYPNAASQLELLRTQKVTHWGTSPKFLAALRRTWQGSKITMESLQSVTVAGSPLTSELYQWLYNYMPNTVGLFSGSGGTDLVGGIVMGSPIANIYTGEISTASLGMKVEIWDKHGKNIEDSGKEGDLIIAKPFFSMPVTFWGLGGEEKYRKAYFEQFPGVWCHGDYIRKNPATGGYGILGRSDGVLNPGGVRFGTAELYAVVDQFVEVEDCIAVGQKLAGGNGEQVLLFLKLRKGPLDINLRCTICAAIREALSARHVPAHVLQVDDIPYTVNGKKMENLVRDLVNGKSVTASGIAENPECLQQYRQFRTPARAERESKL